MAYELPLFEIEIKLTFFNHNNNKGNKCDVFKKKLLNLPYYSLENKLLIPIFKKKEIYNKIFLKYSLTIYYTVERLPRVFFFLNTIFS